MSEKELRINFYQKLDKKLDLILNGEMSLENYSKEVKEKISLMKKEEEEKNKKPFFEKDDSVRPKVYYRIPQKPYR